VAFSITTVLYRGYAWWLALRTRRCKNRMTREACLPEIDRRPWLLSSGVALFWEVTIWAVGTSRRASSCWSLSRLAVLAEISEYDAGRRRAPVWRCNYFRREQIGTVLVCYQPPSKSSHAEAGCRDCNATGSIVVQQTA
jgi:hypothetical protein